MGVAWTSRALAVGVVAASCGRVGFDGQAHDADARAADAAADAPSTAGLVAVSTQVGSGTEAALSITTVTPGDLLIVAITTWDGTAVANVTDASGSALTSAGVRAEKSTTSSELWYAAPSPATDSVTVTMAASCNGFDVWVAEFAGVAKGPPAAIASGCLEYPPDIVVAPVTTTVPNQLVVGTTMLAAPLDTDAVVPPFTALEPFLSGNGAGYYVASTPGSYAPSWTPSAGSGMPAMTCASTAAFSPVP